MSGLNCDTIWPLFLPPSSFLLLGWWVRTLLRICLVLSTDYFIKTHTIVGTVSVKYKHMYGLIFPSSTSTAISQPWKLIRNFCQPPILQLYQLSGAMDWLKWQGREISEYLGHGERKKADPDVWTELMLKDRPRCSVGHKSKCDTIQ